MRLLDFRAPQRHSGSLRCNLSYLKPLDDFQDLLPLSLVGARAFQLSYGLVACKRLGAALTMRLIAGQAAVGRVAPRACIPGVLPRAPAIAGR